MNNDSLDGSCYAMLCYAINVLQIAITNTPMLYLFISILAIERPNPSISLYQHWVMLLLHYQREAPNIFPTETINLLVSHCLSTIYIYLVIIVAMTFV